MPALAEIKMSVKPRAARKNTKEAIIFARGNFLWKDLMEAKQSRKNRIGKRK